MEPTDSTSGRRAWLAEALLCLAVLLLAVKVTYDVGHVRDSYPGDEPAYMFSARLIPTRGLQPAEYGPLYSLWYFALSHLQPVPVRLYFLNWSLLVVLQSVSLYALVRSLGGGRAAGLLTVAVLLSADLFDTYPYLMHLATTLLALGTILALRARSWAVRWLVLSLTFLLASYVRPELYLAFLACAGGGLLVVLVRLWRGSLRPASGALAALAIGACGLTLGWGVGVPLGGRSFAAFGQHYACHAAEAISTGINPMVRWEDFIRADFGDAQTFTEALRANPRAVLWHVGLNAATLPRAMYALIAPRPHLPGWLLLAVQLSLVAAAILALVVFVRRRSEPTDDDRRAWAVFLVPFGLVVGLALVSSLLIFPRPHYLMPVAFFGAALIAANLSLGRCEGGPGLALVLLLAFALVPNRAHGWDAACWLTGERPTRPDILQEQSIAGALRRLPLRSSVVFLDYFGHSRTVMAGLPLSFVQPTAKHGPFGSFVRDNDISVIVLDPDLCNDPAYRDDPEFQDLALGNHPGDFTLIAVQRTYVRLAVRKDKLTGPVADARTIDPNSETAYYVRVLHDIMHHKD